MRLLCLVLTVGLTACGQQEEEARAPSAAEDKSVPVVYTVNYPLAWLAQQLSAGATSVEFPAPTGEDPAFWKPPPEIVARYQQADLVLLNGANYARWLAQVSMPANRLRDTSAGFAGHILHESRSPVHSHGPEGAHSHTKAAFTVWLDLSLMALQAESVAVALQELLPGQATAIEERLATLQQQLAQLDTELQSVAAQLEGAPVLYSHPVYQYLQRRYNINGVALHWEPDQFPAEQEWARLQALLQSHPAQLMLWEDDPLPQVAQRLAEIGIAVVVFRPQGNWPAAGDFASNMRGNIDRLRSQ
ncbi:MAG: metal ABC transporter substrate-binding protein [Gammaproteobacteria bacterium]|nr:metal ABC transporter substrate-binding protein [Gammaproteobacteria bacterium]